MFKRLGAAAGKELSPVELPSGGDLEVLPKNNHTGMWFTVCLISGLKRGTRF